MHYRSHMTPSTTSTTTDGSGLTTQYEGELARRARGDDSQALRELVEAHQPMVEYMIRQRPHGSCGPQDLRQQGTLGLLRAIETFEPERGLRFWTYARWWVRASIRSYVWHNRRIVPLSSNRTFRRLATNIYKAESELGADATPSKIAETLGVSQEDVERVDAALRHGDVSLDGPQVPANYHQDTRSDPEAEADAHDKDARRHQLVSEALESLDSREREIVARRFLTDDPETLAALGRRLHISRERVRQLSERALRKLRSAMEDHGPEVELLVAEDVSANPPVAPAPIRFAIRRRAATHAPRVCARVLPDYGGRGAHREAMRGDPARVGRRKPSLASRSGGSVRISGHILSAYGVRTARCAPARRCRWRAARCGARPGPRP